jgi:serine/threonine protein kinase
LHRDLKPANIMRKMDGMCIIVDFGLSKNTRSGGTVGPQSAVGSFKGTPIYSAPEVSKGSENAMPASDVFSLGVIFYEAVSGHLPFSVETAQQGGCMQGRSKLANFTSNLMTLAQYENNKNHAKPCPLSAQEAPRPLNDFVIKCLSNRPDVRFSSASEMLEPWENAKERADKEKEEKAEQSQANIFWTQNFPGTPLAKLGIFQEIFRKTYELSDAAWANFASDIDEDENGVVDQYEFLNMLEKNACDSMEKVVQKYNNMAEMQKKEASSLEPANVYYSKQGKGKKLVFTDVRFHSKSTMLGISKERNGILTFQHGDIKVHRFEGNKSITEFEFEVAHTELNLQSHAKGIAEVTFISRKATASQDPDKGKPRAFTFKTLEDCDSLVCAIEATKAWMNK